MKKRMFKRAQTFLFLLRRKLTKTFDHVGHHGHHAAAVAVRRRLRLRLVLGVVALFDALRQSAASSPSSSLTRRRYLLQNNGVSRSSRNIHGYCIT
jgi:hypothetical protein